MVLQYLTQFQIRGTYLFGYVRFNTVFTIFYHKLKFIFDYRDSYIFAVQTDDLSKSLEKMAPFFDFSNYPPNHRLFDLKNKAKLGKWKNECAGKNIISAIAVRSKVYSLEMIDDDHYDNIMNSAEGAFDVNPNIKSNMKRCKGVKRHLIEKKN